MTRYGSREVLRILGVKPHVLRYWEHVVPLVRSQRDDTGHRVWTAAQLRLLQRLRHLVVDRGISVNAAGNALLHEASAAGGNAKGALESLRQQLTDILGVIHSDSSGPPHRSDLPLPTEAPTDGATAGKPRSGWSVFDVVDAGYALPPRAPGPIAPGPNTPGPKAPGPNTPGPKAPGPNTPGPKAPGPNTRAPTRGPVSAEDDLAAPLRDPDASPGVPVPRERWAASPPTHVALHSWVPIVYRHLFAFARRDGGRNVAAYLRRILELRFTGKSDSVQRISISPEIPLVVAAPADRVAEFRTAFSGWSHSKLEILSVEYAGYRGARWLSPTLATLRAAGSRNAFASPPRESGTVRGFFLWAADSPDAAVPDLSIVAAALEETHRRNGENETVVATVHRDGRRNLVGENVFVAAPDAAAFTRVLTRGRWSIGPVVESESGDADVKQRWRYDLPIARLAERDGVWLALPRSRRPALWRGIDWSAQIPAVWPEVGGIYE